MLRPLKILIHRLRADRRWRNAMHRPTIYAIAAHGQVLGCTCGKAMVHVQYGNCTLTLTESEFLDFSLMIEEAAGRAFPLNGLIQPHPGK
jgi:hypothetical protein